MAKSKTKGKGGRPSRYDTEIKDKLPAIQGWARNGLSIEQIAHNLGIHKATLCKYKNEHDELNDALKKGREVADFEVENALHKRATGYDVVEVKEEYSDKDGKKVTKTVRHIPPDVGAAAFWLKNRKPNEWRDKREIGAELQGDGSIVFNIMPASQRPPEEEESEA